MNLVVRNLLDVLCCASKFLAKAICLCDFTSNESDSDVFCATAKANIEASTNSAENIKYGGKNTSGFVADSS